MADNAYPDLKFTRDQLFLSREEALQVATDFWGDRGLTPAQITDRDRAFLQRALLIAVDKSEKAGYLFDVWASWTSAAPKRAVKALVKELAKRTAKRWFKGYIDDTPKISAVGKSAVQYSGMTTEWRVRCGTRDDSMLTNYLVGR